MNSIAFSPSVFYSPAPGTVASVPASGAEPEVSGSAAAGAGNDRDSGGTGNARKTPPAFATDQGLTPEELEQLTELKARDREVRAHEAAHQAAGGQYAGAMSLTYERGPDGVSYAVAGEVSVDVSPVSGDPSATIEKMRVIRAAALAPADPSGQDRAVAAQAMKTLLEAQSELIQGEGSAEPAAPEEEESSSVSGSEQMKANAAYLSVAQISGQDGPFSGTNGFSVST